MVSVIAEKKGNATFYFLRHNSGKNQLKRYLGKSIPKNIEQLKKEFLLEFYTNEWNPIIKTIYKNYQNEIKPIPEIIKLKNFESFGITFTYNTQRMEGSVLTNEDTRNLLAHGVTPNRKSKIDTIETQKHYDLFLKLVGSKKLKNITTQTVLCWHKEMFDQTMIGEAGSIRTYVVGIHGSDRTEFVAVPKIKTKLKNLFEWINKYDGTITPVELACRAHHDFVMIHPFGDGNGRVSRLLMNSILFKYAYPLLNINFKDRITYFKSLEQSNLNDDSIHFVKWFMKYYIKSNKKYQ